MKTHCSCQVCGNGSEKAEEPLLSPTEAPRKGENPTPDPTAQEAAGRVAAGPSPQNILAVDGFIESEALTSLKAAERPRLSGPHKAALHLHFACVSERDARVAHGGKRAAGPLFCIATAVPAPGFPHVGPACHHHTLLRGCTKTSLLLCVCVFLCVYVFSFQSKKMQEVMCPAPYCLFCAGNRMLTQRRGHQLATGPQQKPESSDYRGVCVPSQACRFYQCMCVCENRPTADMSTTPS